MSHKLDMAQKYGFAGVEVFYEDLLDMASCDEPSAAAQLSAARSLRRMCEARGLGVACLQPFMHYGGETDRRAHRRRVEEFRVFVAVARELGTDLVVLPSSFLPAAQVTEDLGVIVEDLREVADIAAAQTPAVKVAYEALAWGTRVDTWEGSWEVVRRVGRDNFGICFDSFNLAGRVYADPASATGRTGDDAEEAVAASVRGILEEVDPAKVFAVQVADAERLGEGYLPCREVLDAVVNGLGYEGWLSFEVFNRRLAERDGGVPEEMAARGARSWARMVEELGLKVEGRDGDAGQRDVQARL